MNRDAQDTDSEAPGIRSDGALPAHSTDPGEVAKALATDIGRGLSSYDAALRLETVGPNAVTARPGPRWVKLAANQFSSIIVLLLAAAALIALLTGNPLEAAAILVVLLLNAAIGFTIEWQAGRALEALRNATRSTARTRRDGVEMVVPAEEIVPGDVLALSAGDRVPADARIVEAVGFETDESTLTGESLPVAKSVTAVTAEAPLAERTSMVFLGTNVTAGRARAIVTNTGRSTELGRIGELLADAGDTGTPLERRLAELGRWLVYVVLAVAAVVFATGWLHGESIWLMMEVSISLAVAAVPEGLPAVTTLILALGVLRMARRNAIVRRLAAVETLGSTTVICTDKTGTLTENRMTVVEIATAAGETFDWKAPAADIDPVAARILRVGVHCSEASFHPGEKRAIGDPTETALLEAAHRSGIGIDEERAGFEKTHEVSFDAVSKRMIVVVRDSGGRSTAMMKGAPAVVLAACSTFADGNGERTLTPADRERILRLNDTMAESALRVLAFAERPQPDDSDFESGFTFLGYAGMIDPLRESAPGAVEEARLAGIRVVMLTGDQLPTARAIAARLRLGSDGRVEAVHSHDLASLSPDEFAKTAARADVFARVTPEDKLRIVEALRASGEIVAVTGDGVNDAPALKRADIGVAMGLRGTEVAKESADIVLTDDNFATIVEAIERGRTIYANIIKFVHLFFAKNLAEVITIFVAIAVGWPLPLLPLQLLWLNLVSDVFPAFALAVEPPAADAMRRPPKSPRESFLSRPFVLLIARQAVILSVITLAAYYWALQVYGEGAHARTIALLAMVAVQIGHLFNCRSRTRSAFDGFFRNKWAFASVAVVTLLQFAAIYVGPLAAVLEIERPAAEDWGVVAGCVVLPVVIVEIEKFFLRRTKRRRPGDVRSKPPAAEPPSETA